MPQNKTNRMAAIYFPLSKGNRSKPGTHESSRGSRKPISTESLCSILTPLRGKGLSPAAPAQAKYRFRPDSVQLLSAEGYESAAMATGLSGSRGAASLPLRGGRSPLPWAARAQRRQTAIAHSRVCPFPLFLHPGIPTPARLSPGTRCRDAGRLLQAAGASRQGCQEHRPAKTEHSLHVKRVESLCMPQTTKTTSPEPLYLIIFPRLCGPRHAAARLSSARCHPHHRTWVPGLLWTVFQSHAQKFNKPENTYAPHTGMSLG